jgi:hypothetical protein
VDITNLPTENIATKKPKSTSDPPIHQFHENESARKNEYLTQFRTERPQGRKKNASRRITDKSDNPNNR